MSETKKVRSIIIEDGGEYEGMPVWQELPENVYQGRVFLPSVARDLVMYGTGHASVIAEKYSLTDEEFLEIAQLPVFKAEVAKVRETMESSAFGVMQMKASTALEEAVDILRTDLRSATTSVKDRVAVVRMLKDLAMIGRYDRVDNETGEARPAGTVIKFSFGNPAELPRVMVPSVGAVSALTGKSKLREMDKAMDGVALRQPYIQDAGYAEVSG